MTLDNAPVRQQMTFPEVAIIRKGTPKVKGGRDGDQWIQGRDLGEKFRIDFLAGTGGLEPELDPVTGKPRHSARSAFHEIYKDYYVKYDPKKYNRPDGYEIKSLRCMIPFRDALTGWYWAHEAYNAGRLIAKADDNHYITKRDPLTGEYLVRNGEPEFKYLQGDVITYENRKGNKITLPMKTHGRLRLFLPDIFKFVSFTVKTSSYYDRLTIEQGLGAIAGIADTLNQGNAGGVPFYLYRAKNNVCWNHKDGTASRVDIWSIYLQIDDDWVKQAVRRLSDHSLGYKIDGLLQAGPMEITGTTDPNTPDADEDGPEITNPAEPEYVDVTAQDVTEAVEPEPESGPVTPVQYQSKAPKKLQGPTGGPIAWLMNSQGIAETSQAAMIANNLKLTERGLTEADYDRRYSNYRALLDAGKNRDEAAALTLKKDQGE